MAIGTVKLSGSPAKYLSDEGGHQVGAAMQGLAGSLGYASDVFERLNLEEKDRKDKKAKFDAEARWAEEQAALLKAQMDHVQSAPANGEGLTKTGAEMVDKRLQAFLATVPEDLRDEFNFKTRSFASGLTVDMYGKEVQLRSEYEKADLSKLGDSLASAIMAGNASQESAAAQLEDVLNFAGMPEADKQVFREEQLAKFGRASFETELGKARVSGVPVGPADGSNMVLGGVPPLERGILNTTASVESPGGAYDVRNDGSASGAKFTDFSQHPNVRVILPDGTPTTAAGRYQMIFGTWERARKALGLTDFSPVSQDRAAQWLLEEDYNAKKSPEARSYDEVIADGTDAELIHMRQVLTTTWAGLKSLTDAEFIARVRGEHGEAGGGTGTPDNPGIWNDPNYAHLRYADKRDMAVLQAAHVKAQQAAQQAALENNWLAAEAAYTRGDMTAEEVDQLAMTGQIPLKRMGDAQKLIKKDREDQLEAGRAAKLVQAGVTVADTKENRDALELLFKKTGAIDGLQSMDGATGRDVARAVASTGVMPDSVKGLLTGMAQSNDPKRIKYAMDVATSIRQKNPMGFGGQAGKELLALAVSWDYAVRFSQAGNEAQVMTQFQLMNSPEGAAIREKFADTTKTELLEISDSKVVGHMRGSYLWQAMQAAGNVLTGDTLVQPPANPRLAAMWRADFDAAYKMLRPYHSDAGETARAAGDLIGHNWTPSNISGTTRFTYLAPESPLAGYPNINGSMDWQRQYLLDQLKLDPDTKFSVHADAQSLAEVTRGERPSYTITVYNDVTGQFQFVSEADTYRARGDMGLEETPGEGVPARIRFELTPEVQQGVTALQELGSIDKDIADLYSERETLLRRPVDNDATKQGLAAIDRRIRELRSERDAKEPAASVVQLTTEEINKRILFYQRQRDMYAPDSDAYKVFNERMQNVRNEFPGRKGLK